MDLRAYQHSANLYSHLSLRDLLDAREQYHVHLMRMPNVIATAVGKYRIRTEDSRPGDERQHHSHKPRTLANSEVRDYSWPAILVFVDDWKAAAEFGPGGTYDADVMVPKTLYLPDGRRVPVCVIEAPKQEVQAATPADIVYPLNNIGGGYPVLVNVQGREHVATISCLVSDGHKTYALTNRHVTGEPGELVYSKLGGKLVRIGRSAEKRLAELPFGQLYPSFPGDEVRVNLDVGLIEIDDLDRWTAQVRDVGTVAPLADLSSYNVSLSLIGCAVKGRGASGGMMAGEIQALFYRYKSSGGFEYVADIFIGPLAGQKHGLQTLPGDSGTLWMLEPLPTQELPKDLKHSKPEPLPLAVQWGQNTLGGSSSDAPQPYALATFLSSACRELSLDLVRDWNLDQDDTWGAVGHFAIAAHAPVGLSSAANTLAALLKKNAEIIGHTDATILKSDFKGLSSADFVPLADVPDFFWKHGTQGAARHFEGPNHFADMDQPRPEDGKTLLDLYAQDPLSLDPDRWNAFYGSVTELLTGDAITPEHRGVLPFRVWQIFDAMVGFVQAGKLPEFVCAAGVLAHYVGDACQPLHISYLHDGDPEQPQTRSVHHRDGTDGDKTEPLGIGVHAAYEDDMVNTFREDLLNALQKTQKVKSAEYIRFGVEAGRATVELMQQTFARLPPRTIVEEFIKLKSKNKADRTQALWEAFGDDTQEVMKAGAHLLARLWESAWVLGKGDETLPEPRALTEEEAMNTCRDRDFLPSLSVADFGRVLSKAGV